MTSSGSGSSKLSADWALVGALARALEDVVDRFDDERATAVARRALRDGGLAAARSQMARSIVELDALSFRDSPLDDGSGRFYREVYSAAVVAVSALFDESRDASVDAERRAQLREALVALSADDEALVEQLVDAVLETVERSDCPVALESLRRRLGR